MSKDKYYIKRLFPYISVKDQIFIVVIIMLTTLVGLSIPQIIGGIIDKVIGNNRHDYLMSAGLLLGATILVSLLEYLQSFILARASENVARKLRKEIYNKLLELDYRSRNMTRTGDLISLFNNDVNQVYGFTSSFVSGIIAQGILLVILIVVLLVMSIKLTLYSIITIPLYFVCFFILAGKLRKFAEERQKKLGIVNSTLQEDIVGMNTIQSYLAENDKRNVFNSIMDGIYRNNVRFSIANNLVSQSASFIAGLGNVIVIWVGSQLVLNNDFTIGELVAFSSYLGRLYSPILSLVTLNQVFQSIFPSLKRIFHFLDYDSKIKDTKDLQAMTGSDINIKFEDVSLSDLKGNKILKNINFEIQPGSFTAFIGESGAGKTTICNLFNRILQPTSGKIYVNDVDYTQLPITGLREKVGTVFQESAIFTATIKDNLTLLRSDFSDMEINEALENAVCNFVKELPDGLNSIVDDRGNNLSTGEKQRLFIARSLLRNYKVLILDEPTSAIDNITRFKFINSLTRIRKDKTTIIVSHRLEDIIEADRIYVLREGEIIAYGTHKELIAGCEYYQQLYNQQIAS